MTTGMSWSSIFCARWRNAWVLSSLPGGMTSENANGPLRAPSTTCESGACVPKRSAMVTAFEPW